jgi:hypothetical protein
MKKSVNSFKKRLLFSIRPTDVDTPSVKMLCNYAISHICLYITMNHALCTFINSPNIRDINGAFIRTQTSQKKLTDESDCKALQIFKKYHQ